MGANVPKLFLYMRLKCYSFVEIVMAMKPFYIIRVMGGLLYLLGAFIMVYNFWRTIRGDVNTKEYNAQAHNQTQGAPA